MGAWLASISWGSFWFGVIVTVITGLLLWAVISGAAGALLGAIADAIGDLFS